MRRLETGLRAPEDLASWRTGDRPGARTGLVRRERGMRLRRRLGIADKAGRPRRTGNPATQDLAVIGVEDEMHVLAARIDAVGEDHAAIAPWRSVERITFRGDDARHPPRWDRRGVWAGRRAPAAEPAAKHLRLRRTGSGHKREAARQPDDGRVPRHATEHWMLCRHSKNSLFRALPRPLHGRRRRRRNWAGVRPNGHAAMALSARIATERSTSAGFVAKDEMSRTKTSSSRGASSGDSERAPQS